ncbi:hypothetical protein FRC18_006683 [Serendipita sp. 400]|nr:hypothetical protein FRC18_006683 [Serendipita sp. 400]
METRTSDRFPSGYGDMTLQSSDGVVCHFPKSILAYSSEVFRTMLEPPTGQDTPPQGTVSNPLVVLERAEILEAFLDHIDPNTLSPTLNPQIVLDILEAARKYNIPVIFSWFQKEFKIHRYDHVSDETTQSLMSLDPLKLLNIALKFELETVGRWAVKELLGCSSELLVFASAKIPIVAIDKILNKRKLRHRRYLSYIQRLANGEGAPKPPWGHWQTNKYEVAQSCMPCVLLRSQWILWLNNELQNSPKWSTFQEGLDEPAYEYPFCPTHKLSWINYTSRFIIFERQIKESEEQDICWPL